MRSTVITLLLILCSSTFADEWKREKVWQDGLVEKVVYDSVRVVYGKPRNYRTIVFTNKEDHDRRTLTKADRPGDTISVWKLNQIEEIPTPNYRYHYVTTSHLSAEALDLVRLDSSSQEFCGTSFKQYLRKADDAWDYWSFSYMPETGRKNGSIRQSHRKVVAFDSLPLFLRDMDFRTGASRAIALLPGQRSNRPTGSEAVYAEIRFAGDEGGSHKVELHVEGKLFGTFWMARDRMHVMTRYAGEDGQRHELREQSRVNYWTIEQ
jgi:hypothetical protein